MQQIYDLLFGPGRWGYLLLEGLTVTIQLALVTLPIGLLLGLGFAGLLLRARPLFRLPVQATCIAVRAIPELLTIIIIYYGGQLAIRALFGDGIEIGAFFSGVVALALVFAAYSSDVFVSALRAVPKGEIEAAQALGLGRYDILFFIVLPNVFRVSLPALGNLWLILLKDTALVSVIALTDLMRASSVAAGNTKWYFLFYIIPFLLYLLLSSVSGAILRAAERRLARGYAESGT